MVQGFSWYGNGNATWSFSGFRRWWRTVTPLYCFQELDISVAAHGIMLERETVMDFTVPYWIEENTLAYKRLTESKIYIYFKPFKFYVSTVRLHCLLPQNG